MKIRCPECATDYEVDEEIALGGVEVQCARCDTVFAASPVPKPDAAEETAEPEVSLDDFDVAFAEAAEETEGVPETAEAPEPEPEPQPEPATADSEDGAAADEWDAALDAWDSAAEAEAEPETAAEEAPAVAQPALESLLSDEERRLFGALLGATTGDTPQEPAPAEADASDISDIAAELEGLNDLSADDDEFTTKPTPQAEPQEPDIDWIEKDEAPPQPAELPMPADPVEVKDPVLPAAEEEAEPEPEVVATPAADPERSKLLMAWAGLGAFLLLMLTGGYVARENVSRLIPGMADIYAAIGLPVNIRGLDFATLSQQWVEQDGRLRLVVRGEIVNITDTERPLPELVFAINDAGGHEFFQWVEKVDAASLPPRGRTRFRAQIPAPPDRSRKLNIRFAK